MKELKGFQKISLQPGEKRKVSFAITKDQLSFYSGDLECVAEPGLLRVFVGPNSIETTMAEFTYH